MSFEHPGLLWLALALPALVALGFWSWTRRRRRAVRAFGSAGLLERLGAGDLSAFPIARLAILCLAAASLGLAAAGPRWGIESVAEGGRAADLVLALDVSRSMLARDVTPDRMERQRILVRRILRELPGDRIGLVAFAGRAYALTPVTSDHGALHLYLDALDPDIVSQGGSTLSIAIRQATDLARGPDDAVRGVVVLVSDGEAHEDRGAVLRSADRASQLGITVHTVGVGTREGAPVPARESSGRAQEYTRGPDGEIAVTRLDEDLLLDVAGRTGGRYFGLGDAGSTDALVRTLRGLDREEGEARTGVRERPRYAWFVLLTLLLLAVDGLLAGRAGGRGRAALAPAPAGMGRAGAAPDAAREGVAHA
jgi:Ca-activated chloride channel homolog